jgi:hypothetical protein
LFHLDFLKKNIPKELLSQLLSENSNYSKDERLDLNKKILRFVVVNKIIPLNEYLFFEFTFQFQKFYGLISTNDHNSFIFRSNIGKYSIGNYIGCEADKNIVFFEVPPSQVSKLQNNIINNFEIIDKYLNNDITQNNPWILKVKF